MSVAPRIDAVRTTCPYCGVGCGVIADPTGAIAGDKAHPANAGRLCSKGAALGETLTVSGRLRRRAVGGQRPPAGEFVSRADLDGDAGPVQSFFSNRRAHAAE